MSDFSQYLQAYLEEFDEVLQTLDTELLTLEKDGGNLETIQRFFRAAHTLKGSSAAMGFESIKQLTHHMENVFDDMRNGILAVSPKLVNLIFACLDILRNMKIALADGTIDQIDIMPMVEKLSELKGDSGTEVVSDSTDRTSDTKLLDNSQMQDVMDALEAASNAFFVRVQLESDSIMKSVRHLMAYNALTEYAVVLTPAPDFGDEDDVNVYSYVIITTAAQDEIEQSVGQVSSVDEVIVQEITLENVKLFVKQSQQTVQAEKNVSEVAIETGRQVTQMKINQTVRVDVERLESLLNLVGELVIDNTRLAALKKTFHHHVKDRNAVQLFDEISNHISRVVSDLQTGMMKTRMFPIDQLFNRFPRMIRDLANQSGKELDFVIEGKETELDRNLIEEISDPLIHLLRNAVDHGIETPEEREMNGKPRKARLLLRAEHAENQVMIRITDNGRGIDADKIRDSAIRKGFISEEEGRKLSDREAIQLIFSSGVSTANQVTEISGRGVGMDIVRAHIEKLNGIVDIDTQIGVGTTFTIKVPLTLAIIRSLLVAIGRHMFAIPLVNVMEIVRVRADEIRTIKDLEVCSIRGTVYPIVRMHSRLMQSYVEEQKHLTLVVLGLADKRVGLVVDETIGNQEIVIKSLGQYVGHVPYIAGSTILGDGNVSLILDVAAIIREEGSAVANLEQSERSDSLAFDDQMEIVTFRMGEVEYGLEIQNIRDIIRLPQVTPLATAPVHVLGVIHSRGNLLPLYDLKHKLSIPPTECTAETRIIVVELGERDIGIIVDKVSEVAKIDKRFVEERPQHVPMGEANFISGIYKGDNRVVILLNMDWLVNQEVIDAQMTLN
jgi:two-component system chemotaxis sensor kinase CheA